MTSYIVNKSIPPAQEQQTFFCHKMKNICSELNKPINYINMNLLILFNIFEFGIETIQHVENDEIPLCIVNAFKQKLHNGKGD